MERLICIAIGYACGLFQTAYILGKIYHIDIRKQGSGNLGSTNVLRTLGKKAGALNLLCDCLKCIAAILIVRAIFGNSYGDILPLLSLYAAAGCILGHNFPFYLNFKGGKGVAASVGLVIAFDWRIFYNLRNCILWIVFPDTLCFTVFGKCISGCIYQYDRIWTDGFLSYGFLSYDRALYCYGTLDSTGILQT